MNNEETVTENKPVEEVTNDEDFFADVDNEVIKEQENQPSDEETKTEENEPSEPTEEDDSKEEEGVDFTPLLKELSKKVKYNKESVDISDIEDLVNGYQKGLNYDKLQSKYDALQGSRAETYLKKKAEELGMSVDEYITEVENYEKEQQKLQEQEKLEEMINNGVPEDIAKEVIATSQLRKQLQAKENELKEREENNKKEAQKNQEYQDFISKFPDVNPEDIPKEVFVKAQESSLVEAYKDYEIQELKRQLEIAKTNEKNSKSSVGAVNTNNGGGTENKKTDLFLEGFDEV